MEPPKRRHIPFLRPKPAAAPAPPAAPPVAEPAPAAPPAAPKPMPPKPSPPAATALETARPIKRLKPDEAAAPVAVGLGTLFKPKPDAKPAAPAPAAPVKVHKGQEAALSSLTALLSKPGAVIVAGKAGSGKSTLISDCAARLGYKLLFYDDLDKKKETGNRSKKKKKKKKAGTASADADGMASADDAVGLDSGAAGSLDEFLHACKHDLGGVKSIGVIDHVESLSKESRRQIAAVLKRTLQIRLVLTTDSLFDNPVKRWRKALNREVVLRPWSESDLRRIIHEKGLEFGVDLKAAAIEKVLDAASCNLALALQTLEWGIRTMAAKRRLRERREAEAEAEAGGAAEADDGFGSMDDMFDLFGTTAQIFAHSKHVPTMGDADLSVLTAMVSANAPKFATDAKDMCKALDALAHIDATSFVGGSASSAPLEDRQAMLTTAVRGTLPKSLGRPQGGRFDMPNFGRKAKTSLFKEAAAYAGMPSDAIASHERLMVIKALLASESRLTKGNEWYHEDADVRDLRKKGLGL